MKRELGADRIELLKKHQKAPPNAMRQWQTNKKDLSTILTKIELLTKTEQEIMKYGDHLDNSRGKCDIAIPCHKWISC